MQRLTGTKAQMQCHPSRTAFTLVEMAIVLTIIALLVGGVLAGQDVINAAKVRSQLSQINQIKTAVGAFQTQFDGALPGDIKASTVTAMGFTAAPTRTGAAGRGNGDGILQGFAYSLGAVSPQTSSGENAFFWEDLSTNSGLIGGNFNTATDAAYPVCCQPATILPPAKLNGLYLYSYSLGSTNYLGLSTVSYNDLNGALYVAANVFPGISPVQAYNMDSKIDDGLPQTGSVVAKYQNWGGAAGNPRWAGGPGPNPGGACNTAGTGACNTSATPASATTCYDNGNTAGATQQYSVTFNGGEARNCGLSFQLQQ